MAQYLSDEWLREMEVAAASIQVDAGSFSMRESISNTPFGDVSYVITIGDGKAALSTENEVDADVTFSQTYETAVALHKGELTIRDAFFAGRVRVAGHLNTLLDNADLLQGLSPAFETVRANTSY